MSAPYSRFDSETEYRQALETVIGLARDSIRIFDHDLRRMQLETPRVSRMLQVFLGSGTSRRIHIAVHDPGFLQTDAPRLLHLLENYSHAMIVKQVPESLHMLADCHLLADGIHGARRFHKDFPRGALLLQNAHEVAPWWRRFTELDELCQPIDLTRKSGL